jgi:hypothetical protein
MYFTHASYVFSSEKYHSSRSLSVKEPSAKKKVQFTAFERRAEAIRQTARKSLSDIFCSLLGLYENILLFGHCTSHAMCTSVCTKNLSADMYRKPFSSLLHFTSYLFQINNSLLLFSPLQ